MQFVNVPEDGVPIAPSANSSAPVPLSSVIAVLRLALLGVAKKVRIPDAAPVRELKGKDVQFERFPLVGVPRTGVTNVGLVANTNDPVPVLSDISEATPLESVTEDRAPVAVVTLRRPVDRADKTSFKLVTL